MLAFFASTLGKMVLVGLLIAGVLGYISYKIYTAGENHVQIKWDADKAKVAAQIAALKLKSQQVTTQVETQYVDRVKVITQKGNTITKYVDRYIDAGANKNCILPKNFVLLHDDAALNVLPAGVNFNQLEAPDATPQVKLTPSSTLSSATPASTPSSSGTNSFNTINFGRFSR